MKKKNNDADYLIQTLKQEYKLIKERVEEVVSQSKSVKDAIYENEDLKIKNCNYESKEKKQIKNEKQVNCWKILAQITQIRQLKKLSFQATMRRIHLPSSQNYSHDGAYSF